MDAYASIEKFRTQYSFYIFKIRSPFGFWFHASHQLPQQVFLSSPSQNIASCLKKRKISLDIAD